MAKHGDAKILLLTLDDDDRESRDTKSGEGKQMQTLATKTIELRRWADDEDIDEEMELAKLTKREQLLQLAKDIGDLNQTFADVGALVEASAEPLTQMEENISDANNAVNTATKELMKAQEIQKAIVNKNLLLTTAVFLIVSSPVAAIASVSIGVKIAAVSLFGVGVGAMAKLYNYSPSSTDATNTIDPVVFAHKDVATTSTEQSSLSSTSSSSSSWYSMLSSTLYTSK